MLKRFGNFVLGSYSNGLLQILKASVASDNCTHSLRYHLPNMSGLSSITSAFAPTVWIFVVFPSCLALSGLLWVVYTRTLHPLASVPGPFWASISRLWYMYRVYVGDMHTVQRQLHEQYGPVVRIGPNEVSTADLSTLPQIYRNQRPLIKTDFVRPASSLFGDRY